MPTFRNWFNSLLALAMCAACVPLETGEVRVAAPPESIEVSGPNHPDEVVSIGSLGLTFKVPESFVVAEDPQLVFLARGEDLPGVLSIATDDPGVVDYEPGEGESVDRINLGAGEAVVVGNASLQGLPPGVVANELLVANGSGSFTLILSARKGDLLPLWEELLSSVSIERK